MVSVYISCLFLLYFVSEFIIYLFFRLEGFDPYSIFLMLLLCISCISFLPVVFHSGKMLMIYRHILKITGDNSYLCFKCLLAAIYSEMFLSSYSYKLVFMDVSLHKLLSLHGKSGSIGHFRILLRLENGKENVLFLCAVFFFFLQFTDV